MDAYAIPARTAAPTLPAQVDSISRGCGVVALVGVATISVICLVVQFVQTDLNWFTTALSVYALGPYAAWLHVAFFAPAPALVMLAAGWQRTLTPWSRIPLAPALLCAGAVGLCLTAAFATDTTAHPVSLHGAIHQWATFAAFLCITTGMIVHALQLRMDAHWRRRFPEAFALGAINIVYFWVFALLQLSTIPRGIGEKVVIGLVLLWIWRAAWWLVRGG